MRYPLHELEEQKMLGDEEFVKRWKPANKPLGTLEDLPFSVERTHTGNLPVYTDFRNGGSRKLTVVRKVFGDVDLF